MPRCKSDSEFFFHPHLFAYLARFDWPLPQSKRMKKNEDLHLSLEILGTKTNAF